MGWLELWKFHSTVLLAGCALDWMFGGLVCTPHLARLMGRMIARLELELERHMKGRELIAGAVLTFIIRAVWRMVPWRLFRLVRSAGLPESFLLLFCLETSIYYQTMATRGLCTESTKVCRSLEDGGVEIARHHVSMVMGRDTSALGGDGIARAAVETMAENVSDGVVAPFLSMALLGPAGGTFYETVNTMNPMIGYKNDTYRSSGCTVVLPDDVLSLVPARITGCLMMPTTFSIPGMDGMNGWRMSLRDRKKHTSPGSAHGETTCTGILHLCLVGDTWHFGSLHKKPFIGEDDRPIVPADIRRASQLVFVARGILAAVSAAILAVV